MPTTTLKCPRCDSPNVTLEYVQKVMANTLDHYCHSVKPQDADSCSTCLDCEWEGRHLQLVGYKDN